MILIAAVVVGAIAAFALFQYVGGVEDRANEDARLVDVLVVKKDIPRGLTGTEARDQGYIVEDEINAKYKPVTAVNDANTIAAKVAVTNLAAGQVLVEGMFADPIESQITAARRIPTGNVAITVSVDQIRGVAGLLVPGDFVNILVQPDIDLCGSGGNVDLSGAPEEVVSPVPELGDTSFILCDRARYLYQEVQILFVDKSPIPLPGEQTQTTTADGSAAPGGNSGLITFAVPPQAAQVIASVPQDDLYFTLLPTDYAPTALPPIEALLQLLPGEDQNQLTPYGPNGLQEQ
jgi:pilus assembly protein CpaB